MRKGDYFIALRKRTEIARESQADVFLSIHADAFKAPKVSETRFMLFHKEARPARQPVGWLKKRIEAT